MTESEIAGLPEPALRYLRFAGVVGRPRIWSFRMRSTGWFRMRPDRPWLPCEAWQYNSRLQVARIFHMRLWLGPLPVYVRDTYVGGHGRMLGRVLDRLSIVDDSSEKVAVGELVTYLNDAVLLAPSMVLVPAATWTAVDGASFDIALTDGGRTVAARVFVDDRGAVTSFVTNDRYGTDPAGSKEMVRARWSTPVRGWHVADGRRVAKGGRAVWHFPSGDFAYADFAFGSGEDLTFDVPAS